MGIPTFTNNILFEYHLGKFSNIFRIPWYATVYIKGTFSKITDKYITTTINASTLSRYVIVIFTFRSDYMSKISESGAHY